MDFESMSMYYVGLVYLSIVSLYIARTDALTVER